MKHLLKNTLAVMFTVVLAGIFMPSCSTGNGDEPDVSKMMYDIATLTSSSENGSTVTVRKDADSPLITLTFANQQVDTTKVAIGQRFVIAYVPLTPEPYQSGAAVMYAYLDIYNGTMTVGTKESTNSWATMQQDLMAIWRTGHWINIQAMCTYDKLKPAKYDLVVNQATLNDEYPEAYLLYERTTTPGANTKTLYTTFNIDDVWDRDDVLGLKINVFTDQGQQTFTFKK